jgi:myo-inositol-1(or 4)-monophosphatase
MTLAHQSMLSDTARFALDVAREAADLTMRILPDTWTAKAVQYKGPRDLVTRADHETERLIAARIRARYPGHAIIGEEGTNDPGAAGAGPPGPARNGPRWYIDPIDGTSNFAHGLPWFAVSIGFEDQGVLQCGVVAVPPLREYYVAERGRGAYLVSGDGGLERLVSSKTADLGAALAATGLPGEPFRSAHIPTIAPIMACTHQVRITGSAAIHLAYVAAGRLEVFWEPGLHSWDVAGGIILVEEAGGRVSDASGRPLVSLDGEIVATNGPLHDAFVRALGDARDQCRR